MKSRKLITALALLLMAAAVCGLLAGCVSIDGESIPSGTTELDLSVRGLTDVSALCGLKKLEKLDLRGNYVSPEQFDELAEALPECDIVWSVPFGTAYCDSSVTEFNYAAKYVDDLYNIRYLTEISSCDVTGTRADDERLYELNMSIPDIDICWAVNVNGTDVMTNAESLDLSSKPPVDPSVIKYFTDLRELKLAKGQLDDLSLLGDLTRLESLSVPGCGTGDISALAGLKSLRELDLSGTFGEQPVDLELIAGLDRLETLDLDSCSAVNYEALTKLPALKSLDLSYADPQTDDYSFLAGLSSGLESLDLDASGILSEDLKYLSGLSSLRELSLDFIFITDPTPLCGLTSLEKLTISGAGLSADQLNDLLKALPGCNITIN